MKLRTERNLPLIICFLYLILILICSSFLFSWWVALICNIFIFIFTFFAKRNITKNQSESFIRIKNTSYRFVLENYFSSPLRSSIFASIFSLLPTTYFIIHIFSILTVYSIVSFYRMYTIYILIKK